MSRRGGKHTAGSYLRRLGFRKPRSYHPLFDAFRCFGHVLRFGRSGRAVGRLCGPGGPDGPEPESSSKP